MPANACFYVRDDYKSSEVLRLLTSSDVKAKVYKDTKEVSKKDVLKEFNNQKLSYIISKESLTIERVDLRAVIFYGMPKYIERLYKECLKAGNDDKAAKCIVIWSPQDLDAYKNLLEENCEMVESPFVDYCTSLLMKMKEYCEEWMCRRWMIRKYFNKNLAPTREFHDTCCDFCQKIIMQRVPLNLIYEELAEDCSIDISQELRSLLSIYNEHKDGFIEKECIIILQGKKLEKPCPLEYFGTGNKLEGFWKYVFKLAIDKNFLKIMPPHQITNSGLNFLRIKRKSIEVFATPELCESLTRKNVNISIVDEEIIVKSRVDFISQEDDKNLNENVFLRQKGCPLPIDESDNLFEFGVVHQKPALKKRKIQEEESPIDEKPKKDWREALAAALARKDNNKFHNSKQDGILESKAPLENIELPGCSHWSFPPNADHQVASSSISNITEEFNDSQQTKEYEKDEEQEIIAYVTTMTSVRNQTKKPMEMPIADLLEYIETKIKNTFD